MARACTINQPQRPSITTRPINDKENDIEMKYDPCRKAYRKAVKRESEISPYEKVDGQQGFTCTYVPNAEANEVSLMSPICVTLDQTRSHTQLPPQPQAVGTWDELVRKGITLGDTGAPAALDPDDPAIQGHAEDQGHGQAEAEEKKETWSELVEIGAVLGDDGTDVLDMKKKVRLWGLTCGV